MCDHPTILEMLNIANPVIANCLIDQVILKTIRILHLSLSWQNRSGYWWYDWYHVHFWICYKKINWTKHWRKLIPGIQTFLFIIIYFIFIAKHRKCTVNWGYSYCAYNNVVWSTSTKSKGGKCVKPVSIVVVIHSEIILVSSPSLLRLAVFSRHQTNIIMSKYTTIPFLYKSFSIIYKFRFDEL